MTDEQIKDALLPCPFCGHAHQFKALCYGDESFIKCLKCGAETKPDVWNTRPQPQTAGSMLPDRIKLKALQSINVLGDHCVNNLPHGEIRLHEARIRTALQAAKTESVDVEALKQAVYAISDNNHHRDEASAHGAIDDCLDHLTTNGYRIVKDGGG